MTKIYPDKHTRKQQAQQRLQTREPSCPLCGISDWRCMDKDHVAGRKFSDDVVVICANCHRKRTDSQKDHPPLISSPVTKSECWGRLILGAVDLLRQLCEMLEPLGLEMIRDGQATTQESQSDGPTESD